MEDIDDYDDDYDDEDDPCAFCEVDFEEWIEDPCEECLWGGK